MEYSNQLGYAQQEQPKSIRLDHNLDWSCGICGCCDDCKLCCCVLWCPCINGCAIIKVIGVRGCCSRLSDFL